MIIGEIIQRVRSAYSKGAPSDDDRLSPRHIYSKFLTTRNKYLIQLAKKEQKLSQWNYSTLNCVEVIETPVSECPCLPPTGCSILRTKYKLPKILTDSKRHLIQHVTTLDGSTVFYEILWTEVKYKAGNKFTAFKPDYFIRDGYIYIVGLTQKMRYLTVIMLTAVFEDPIGIEYYPQLCHTPQPQDECISMLERDFPLDAEYADFVISETAQEIITYYNQQREDITNDTKDSVTEEAK